MAESLQTATAKNSSGIVAAIDLFFKQEKMENKVLIVIEGKDDKVVYKKLFDEDAAVLYPTLGCYHFEEILKSLNPKYADRMIVIKDADFDILNHKMPKYDNMFLTDGHDIEMMIFDDEFEDFLRVRFFDDDDVDIFSKVEKEIRHISYIKWYNHNKSCNLNVEPIKPCRPLYNGEAEIAISDILTHLYRARDNAGRTKVSESDIVGFENDNCTDDYMNLTNGHDLCEGVTHKIIYEQSINHRGRKPTCKGIDDMARAAYSREKFQHTNLHKKIEGWEQMHNRNIIRKV